MAGVSRFDCFPSDYLNGLIGLTADEIAVYTVILMMQYDRGAPVKYEGREREISVRAGMSRGRLGKAVAGLLDYGKLISESGCLHNARAAKEIEKICEKIEKNRENSAKGGEANKQNFEGKHNKNNGGTEPNGYPTGYPKHSPIPRPPSPVQLEGSLTASCPKRVRTQYPEDFEEFWKGYPTDPNMSKKEALEAWKRIGADQRVLALKSLASFNLYCRQNPDYRPIHANRYLLKNRAEGHLEAAQKIEKINERVFVLKDSPPWKAWEKAKGKKIFAYESKTHGGMGAHFETEWPAVSQQGAA